MTVSIKQLNRGEGLRYLLESVVRGDGAVDLSSPLSRYYAESGTPPGRFLGGGLASSNGGQGVAVGSEVSEEHLYNMLSLVGDPVTGEVLGRRSRVGAAAKTKVAAFDLTFSLPKSISVAWALADAGTQAVIYQAHQDAIAATFTYAEQHTFFSRSGTNGVVQESIEGVIAAAFDHWDSRAGDPQLHTHVVVENLAKSTRDGQWRSLDSRAVYKQVVTLSEMHQGIVQDLLAERLGWGFDARQRRHSVAPKWEVAGVSDELQREFSQRSAQLGADTDRRIDEFIALHGRTPSDREIIRLRQVATLATRPDKHHHSLAEQVSGWRDRACAYVGENTVDFVRALPGKAAGRSPRLRLDDLTPGARDFVAARVVAAVGDAKATYTRANLVAETHRQIHEWRFVDPADRIAAAERIVDSAEGLSVLLTPAERLHVPARFRDDQGVSRFTPTTAKIFTTAGVLAAEQRLLAASHDLTAAAVAPGTVAHVTAADLPGRDYGLSDDQAYAVERIATSGRALDVLVGPAGTGKTTSMQGLRAAWEAEHGAGSVIGLAPSAAAAEVLGAELGIATENTAKWLHEHDQTPRRLKEAAKLRVAEHRAGTDSRRPSSARRRAAATSLETAAQKWQFQAGQLVIVDEASLAGTFSLDRIVTAAGDAGAKVLLVGDWAQLSAVESGGAFSMLVADRSTERGPGLGMAPELSDVRRFRNEWEKAASVALRTGREEAIATYTEHGRVHAGDRESSLEQLYAAWKGDVDAGMQSLMIAGDLGAVADLNRRARADLVAAGVVDEQGTHLAAGSVAGVGDQVLTRRNDRTLAVGAGGSWVKNGDRWTVTELHADGSMTVRRQSADGTPEGRSGGAIVLPTEYVEKHVDLAYAVTAHRAQGATVDTAHALAGPTTTREVLYVAATRGREANHLYVDTTYDPDPETSHGPTPHTDVDEVLAGILANTGAEVSATVTARTFSEERESLTHLFREYATMAREADTDHWTRLLETALDTAPERIDDLLSSPGWPALAHALRDIDTRGLEVADAVRATAPQALQGVAVAGHSVNPDPAPAPDQAALLTASLRAYAAEMADGPAAPRDRSVLGLLAYPHVSDTDLKRGLDERVAAMRARAQVLVDEALSRNEPWVIELGSPPLAPAARELWMREARTVAAYRELHAHTAPTADLTAKASGRTQIGDAKAAQAALRRAAKIAAQHHLEATSHNATKPAVTTVEAAIER